MPMVASKAPYTLFIVNDDMPENPREGRDNFGHMICFHSRYSIGDEHKYENTHELFADVIRHSVPDKDIIAFIKDGNSETSKLEYDRSSHEWELNVYSDFFKKWFTEFSASGPLESISDLAGTIIENMKGSEMFPLVEKANCILPVYLYDHSGLTINTTGFTCPWDSGQIGWIYASHAQVKAEYGAVMPENLKKAESLLESEVKLFDYYLTDQCYGFQLFEGDVETDSCWGFFGDIRDVQDAVKEYLPDECKDIIGALQYRDDDIDVDDYLEELQESKDDEYEM
jgi:hypothetical protein